MTALDGDDRLAMTASMTALPAITMTASEGRILTFSYDRLPGNCYDRVEVVTLSYLRLAVSYLATGLTEVKHSDAR